MSLSGLLEIIGQYSLTLMEQAGYGGIFLLAVLDRVLLSLVPAEVVLPFAGFLAGQGQFDLWLVIILVTIGNLAGDLILFWLSAKGGRWLLEKYGRYLLVSKHDLEHTDRIFAKHGPKLVILGRLLPIVRSFIAIPAGIAQMPVVKFIWYTIIGSLPYNLLLLIVGFKSGENWELIKPWLTRLEFLILAIIVGGVVWFLITHLKRKHATH